MTSDIALFLIGSVFPLYCAGYAGLIHIARTDPNLYWIIEAYARRLIYPILCGISACGAIFILVDWLNEDRDWTLFVMTGLPLLLIWHARYSRRFFRTIAAASRKKNVKR